MENAEVIFSYKTKRNTNPEGKPRVYFTCYPEDFDRFFDKISKDIFKTHDCAIYYTDDMTADLSNSNNQTDMERMHLFVIPVTFHLLTQTNRAMDWDFSFAVNKHIPVLPIMMEPGLEEIYGRKDKFGELQFINPYSDDPSEISYDEKLRKYLESVLISDELAQRVRKAFDTYIFLSYRKKDRAYANELMRLIHKNPECRDVAIWFDEFLTPGESFKDNIDRMLSNSDLFALLVTPNLLEKPDGKPNYVMAEEYPAAKKAGKPILPTEMRPTDKQSLKSSFDGIPECVDVHNDTAFKERLLDSIRRVATSESSGEPEHNYLIGLAYLEGIDVEIDVERGLELISSSWESELPEAMEKLYQMYANGDKVSQDYWKALIWAERLCNFLIKSKGENNNESLISLCNLAGAYSKIEDFQKASELFERTYELQCEVLGDMHPDTLITLNNLANIYCKTGDVRKALELYEKAYKLCSQNIGEEQLTIVTLEKLAKTYSMLGYVHEEQELYERAYELRKRLFGEEDQFTIDRLNKLAKIYYKNGDASKARELYEKIYELRSRFFGAEARLTIEAQKDVACAYYKLGDIRKANELNSKANELFCEAFEKGNHSKIMTKFMGSFIYHDDVWGKLEHLEIEYKRCCENRDKKYTIEILKKLANSYHKLATSYHQQGDFCKALELYEKAYELRRKAFGECCPQTITTIKKLARTHSELGNAHRALELYEMACELCFKVYGENDRRTISVLKKTACTYGELGNYFEARKLYEQSCKILHNIFENEKGQRTIVTLKKKASTYLKLGDISEAIASYEKVYSLNTNIYGEEHPRTLTALNCLAVNYGYSGDYQRAKELREKVYTLRCKVLGMEHPDTLRTLYGLAATYDALGEYKKEIELQEKLYDLQCRVFGEQHEKTRLTIQAIKKLKKNLGE